jgi:demethylmenaquinone methyltransferase/2-methoxy-6-polyprenyl-1,4-benzoquinol methylase
MNKADKDPVLVRSLFSRIAPQYDRGNALLSFSLHRLWNRQLVRAVGEPDVLLDLCAGTGAISLDYLNKQKTPKKAILLDFCKEMLDQAKRKAGYLPHKLHTLTYLEANAEQIPLPSSSCDAATLAYGIRNIQHPNACFAEVKRVLKPGGIFAILELTRPKNPLLRLGHALYLNTLLPLMGMLTSGDRPAYEYLSSTIQTFASPEELAALLQSQGFSNIRCQPLWGGIATLITARGA